MTARFVHGLVLVLLAAPARAAAPQGAGSPPPAAAEPAPVAAAAEPPAPRLQLESTVEFTPTWWTLTVTAPAATDWLISRPHLQVQQWQAGAWRGLGDLADRARIRAVTVPDGTCGGGLDLHRVRRGERASLREPLRDAWVLGWAGRYRARLAWVEGPPEAAPMVSMTTGGLQQAATDWRVFEVAPAGRPGTALRRSRDAVVTAMADPRARRDAVAGGLGWNAFVALMQHEPRPPQRLRLDPGPAPALPLDAPLSPLLVQLRPWIALTRVDVPAGLLNYAGCWRIDEQLGALATPPGGGSAARAAELLAAIDRLDSDPACAPWLVTLRARMLDRAGDAAALAALQERARTDAAVAAFCEPWAGAWLAVSGQAPPAPEPSRSPGPGSGSAPVRPGVWGIR